MQLTAVVYIKTLLFFFSFTLLTIALGILGSFTFVMNQGATNCVGRIWAKGSLQLLKLICGVTWKIKAEELPDTPYIIASKHQSVWETIFFLTYLPQPIFIVKAELSKIPIYGWYLKAMGMILINRKLGVISLRLIEKEVYKKLEEGRNIVIFPEGSRTKVNEKPQCKSGISHIYSKVSGKYPIIPVALNSGKIWPPQSKTIHNGTIEVVIHRPLPCSLSKEELLDKIKQKINILN